MGKFIDKLNQLYRAEVQPLGFRTRQPTLSKTKIQLVASVTQEDGNLPECVAGADVGLIRVSRVSGGAAAVQKASRAVPDIPWGVWLKASRPKAVRQVAEMGADFLVFPAATTPLALLEGKETSRILEVELSLGEGWLRVASELPVDAVLVTSCRGDFLAWQDLLVFQRLSDVLTRPLLAATPLAVTGSELQALWEAGVSAIVVEAGASQPQSGLKGLRRLIDGLDFPLPRRREKTRPLLPSLGVKAGAETYESEDEDEEE